MTRARLAAACKAVKTASVPVPGVAAALRPPLASTSAALHSVSRRTLATAVPDDLLPSELKLGRSRTTPDTLVLAPTSDSLGLEANVDVKVTQTEIGRPIYLDAQVCIMSCDPYAC
jgi:hypothetical protein